MAITEKKKHFLLIAATHVRELHDAPSVNLSSELEICSHADDYVNMNWDYDRFINRAKGEFDGKQREEVLEIYEDRKIFHAEKARRLADDALRNIILSLSDGWITLTRTELRNRMLRKKFDKALHDVGTVIDGERQDVVVYGEEIDRDQLPPLACYSLSDVELDALDGYMTNIGRHRARIDALKEIRFELRGADAYDANPERKEIGTVSELGDLLFERFLETGKKRARLVTYGVDNYHIRARPDYRWKPNRFREAVNKSLKRRIEAHEASKKEQKPSDN